MSMRALTIVLVAGWLSATTFTPPVAAQNASADAVYRLQQLQEEVRQLRGLVEQQQRELERLRQRQRDQYLDLDARLQELAGGTVAPPGAAQQPGHGNNPNIPPTTLPGTQRQSPAVLPGTSPARSGSPGTANQEAPTASGTDEAPATIETASGETVINPAVDVPEVRGETDTRATITSVAEPQVRDIANTTIGNDEQAAYDAAFAELKSLRYERAADGFRDFINNYPQSRLADNAQYWLGESYYGARNFSMALDAFQQVLDRYPDSSKRPDALLKVGYSHYELRQWPQARAALEQVQEEFPDTTIARLAENRLRTMRLEGHF